MADKPSVSPDDGFTASERQQLRALLMRVGDEQRQRDVEELANRAKDIISMVEGKKATSAVLKFMERCAKWATAVAAGVTAVKVYFWKGGGS